MMDDKLYHELTLSPSKWKPFTSGPGQLRRPDLIEKAYASGEAGVYHDPAACEEFEALTRFSDYSAVLSQYGDPDVTDRLIYPFQYVMKQYPGIHPGPGQEVGDCVSQDDMRAKATAMVMDVVLGEPDEVSGAIETCPVLTPAQIEQGGFSSEVAYWFRGHAGHGWTCQECATVGTKYAGVYPRGPIEGGPDVSRYSGKTASAYGRKQPPQAIIEQIDNNLVHEAVKVPSDPVLLAKALAKGDGISSCGSEGFSSVTPEYDDGDGACAGPSKRKGSWAHSMAIVAVDLRKEIIAKFGDPLVGILQTWGFWGSGPRRIYGTNLFLPRGAFFAKWSDVKRRYYVAKSGIHGWKRRSLTDLSPHADWGYENGRLVVR